MGTNPTKTAQESTKTAIRVMEHEPFGDPCPFAEPAWYRGVPTPYYNENHAAFRAKVRAWVDENLIPFVDEWDEAYTCPIEKLRLSAHKAGVLSPWAPEELGGTPPEGGWDEFMFVIWADEMSRCGAGGVAILFFITYMALPSPSLNHRVEVTLQTSKPLRSKLRMESTTRSMVTRSSLPVVSAWITSLPLFAPEVLATKAFLSL